MKNMRSRREDSEISSIPIRKYFAHARLDSDQAELNKKPPEPRLSVMKDLVVQAMDQRRSILATQAPFAKIKKKWNIKKYINKFRNNVVLTTVPDNPEVREEWCSYNRYDSLNNSEQSNWLLLRQSVWYAAFEAVGFLVYGLMIWLLSISALFRPQLSIFGSFRILGLVWVLVETVFAMNTERIQNNLQIKNRKRIIINYLKTQALSDAILFLCMLVPIVTYEPVTSTLCEFLAMIILLYRAYSKGEDIERHLDGIIRKEYIKLINSFLLLMFVGHCASLALYAVSHSDPQANWLNRGDFNERNWYCDYIYSLYWAFTTIVTVGYGDIKPVNKYEMLMVIVIEILGSSIFGYMINVIGMTLTDMKKQEEDHESNIKTADKLNRCFGLDRSLAYRVKTYLNDNRIADQSFSLADEEKVMNKLSPALRGQILRKTNDRVVNKCTFFLTYFNRKFLQEISLRLAKKLLRPGEEILTLSDTAMYIVDNGSIDVRFRMMHKSVQIYKKVKTIEKSDQNQISSNVFGYVAAMTNKPNRLSAVSRDFSLVYHISHKDFKEVANEDSMNQQIMYELRHRFELQQIPEIVEAPTLVDPALHFVHKALFVISKLKSSRYAAQRRAVPRAGYKKRLKELGIFKAMLNVVTLRKGQRKTTLKSNKTLNAVENSSLKRKLSTARSSEPINIGVTFKEAGVEEPYQIAQALLQKCIPEQDLLAKFDRVGYYANYFVAANCDRVLEKYQNMRRKVQGYSFSLSSEGSEQTE